MNRKKIPLWQRSCLDELNLTSIESRLGEMSEIEWSYGGGRHEDFYIFFGDIAARAASLGEMLYQYRYDFMETDNLKGWDDLTVVLLGGTHRVLGFDAEELDYHSLFARGYGTDGENAAIEEAERRLMRFTKRELITLWRKALMVLAAYLDLSAAYDGLSAALDFLENGGQKKLEELTGGIESAYNRLWDLYGGLDRKSEARFDAEAAKAFPAMWL